MLVALVLFAGAFELQLLDRQLFVLQALDLEALETTKPALLAFLFIFTPRDLEEKRINRRRNHWVAGEVQKLFRREVDVALIANAMGKVRQVRRVVSGERTVEVTPVRLKT